MIVKEVQYNENIGITNDDELSFIPYAIKLKQVKGIISIIQLNNTVSPRRDSTTYAEAYNHLRGGTALPPRRYDFFTEDKLEKSLNSGVNSYIISQIYCTKYYFARTKYFLRQHCPTDTPQQGCRSSTCSIAACYTKLLTPTAKKGKHLFSPKQRDL